MQAAIAQISNSLAQYSSESRLYALVVGGGADLLVEAFAADDEVQGTGPRDVIVLSTDAHLQAASLLGQPATLELSLADGTRTRFSGDVTQVATLGSNGGFARYRLRLTHWVWRLGQMRNSRVWQDKSVLDIIDDVFSAYQPLARWRWSDEAGPFMADAIPRSYCCQYRETDLAFIERLLAEEGLAWRFEQDGDGAQMVLFADSSQRCAVPEDASSEASGGIRFHGARVGEQQDTIQALQASRAACVSLTTLLSYDYKAKRAAGASSLSRLKTAGLLALENYDVPGQYHYANGAQAQRYADLQMQAREARSQPWHGRSTVRTLRAGSCVTVTQGPLQAGDAEPVYTMLRVRSVGVNNLPLPAVQALAELFGPIPELLLDAVPPDAADDYAQTIAQASSSGYANSFDAIANELPWRPLLQGSGGRSHPRPTAGGAQSAIVVGPEGGDSPNGVDEIYCDRLGRVRIRYHWQDSGDATCWVRVAQRSAGGGMGSQFLPRIGQEVLVQFLENDIDRPIIIGALYNGRGEGGVAHTPGGQPEQGSAEQPFGKAHDHAVSGQGNLASGNSPLWHGASADSPGHRSNASQWGVRSKEFGGKGYNQLLFDDTDAQGRVQLKSSHAATELTLGHLLHNADNYRGSLRGEGAELRTDAYGAVRAGAGMLVTSYGVSHAVAAREPVGDNAAGIALMKQAAKLGETFSDAAKKHETVALASHIGPAEAAVSTLDDKAAPLPAMLTAVSGMVANSALDAAEADAADKAIAPSDNKLPHTTDAVIAISAKAGLGVTAGHDIQLANGETATLMSGGDTQFVTAGKLRAHTEQAIGLLGGAIAAGEGGIGVQLIAAQDAIDVQAQADIMKVQSRDDIRLASANAHVDWAAAKRIVLSTAGGANITIDGGNITVQAPGKITIHAGKKSFIGPERLGYALPAMPRSICKKCKRDAAKFGAPFSLVQS
jgi:uncharacterized protein involved in type VI secretion and phage assembly